jgi:hypothetical protein
MEAEAGRSGRWSPRVEDMIARTPRPWVAAATAVMIFGLGTADTPRVSRLAPHRHVEVVLTVDGASAGTTIRPIARLLQTQFGLPLPARVAAHVYDGLEPFERGLVTYASLTAPHAAEMARFAAGATLPGIVLLRAPALTSSPSVDWPRLIAHELTHLAQIELAGGDTGPAQWLAEGMADWVAYRVVEQLGPGGFADAHASPRADAVEYVRRTGGLDLAALASPTAFVVQHRQVGTVLTYRLTRHLAAELVRRRGFDALVRYFRAFRVSDDAEANFLASFGISVDGFARSTRDRLAVPARPAPPRS